MKQLLKIFLVSASGLGILTGVILGNTLRHPKREFARTREIVSVDRSSENGFASAGDQAMLAGRFGDAEKFYKDLVQSSPGDPYRHRYLATLYDKWGRTREAYNEWGVVLQGRPGTIASFQSDPEVLAHYGELSLEYGTPSEAKGAFAMSAQHALKYFGPDLVPTTDSGTSLSDLRAEAHYASGLAMVLSSNRLGGVEEMKLAVKYGPEDPLAHFGLGFATYMALQNWSRSLKEAAPELLKGEELARDASMRSAMHIEREKLGFARPTDILPVRGRSVPRP